MSSSVHLQQPLAIVGMACRLPGADNLQEYWDLLKEGRSGLSEFPVDRLDPELYYDPQPGQFCKTYTRAAGIVPLRPVDPDILSIEEKVLRQYDVAHQTLCEVIASACIDAGYDPLELPHPRTAVYVGNSSAGSNLIYELMMTDYAAAAAGFLENIPDFTALPVEQQAIIQERLIESIRVDHTRRADTPVRDTTAGIAATMVANLFNLTGPAAVCDAACASATIGLELAAQALFHNRAEMAIVGGCSIRKWYEMVVIAQAATLSAKGISRPFDAAADGLVASDAYAAVIVKTLERAIEEGDDIKAVIRNTSLSSDGRGKSFWAPRREGQVLAIERGYQSGLDPNRLQYLETHATSTQIGDETEVRTLIASIGDRVEHPLPIASVKANIGHSLETAGLSSLIKMILAIQHKTLPPAVNCESLSSTIEWDEIPFKVQQQAEPWPEQPDGSPRMAGVDAFGIGGVNTHVVVEEYDPQKTYEWDRDRSDTYKNEPIAIVGRGAIFAGSDSVDRLAEVISSQLSRISPIPEKRKLRGQASKYDEAGYLSEYEFDWKKHKVPPKLLKQANPLQFALLDAAGEALIDAGYEEDDFDRKEVITIIGSIFSNDYDLDVYWGLFYPELSQRLTPILRDQGISDADIAQFLENFKQQLIDLKPEMLDDTGSASASTLSTRVAKNFDLMGGAFSMDAGEASSQAALLAAVDLLRSGKCERVVCGGAQRWIETSQNVDATTVPPGEGAGVVVLQRLSDAEAQNRTIYGLIDDIRVERESGEETDDLTENNGLSQLIGNTLGAAGMASLLHATLENEDSRRIASVNRRGYYGSSGSRWEIQYRPYPAQTSSSAEEPEEEPAATEEPAPTSLEETVSVNGHPPQFYNLARFFMIQTGCPLKVVQPSAFLEGDLRLTADSKQSVLRELFTRLNHHLEPAILYTCAQKMETIEDVWQYVEALPECPIDQLVAEEGSATAQTAASSVASESVKQVTYDPTTTTPSSQDEIVRTNGHAIDLARELRLLERTKPEPLPEAEAVALQLPGATVVIGSGKTTDLLVEKLAEAGNLVYRLESGQTAETWWAQCQQIETQSPVLNLFLTEGIASAETAADWSSEIATSAELINLGTQWLNLRHSQGNLTDATIVMLTNLGTDFGTTGHFHSVTSVLLSSFAETLVPHAAAGLRLKLIDLFEREPAAMVARELTAELTSNNRETHVSFLRGGRTVRTTAWQARPTLSKEIEVWFPHGSFDETLLDHLPLANNPNLDTDPEGLWLGLEQVRDYSDLNTIVNELQTILTENPTLRKVVILLPEGSDFMKQLAARTLYALCRTHAATVTHLTASLLKFDVSIPNLGELLTAEGNVARSEVVQLASELPHESTAAQRDALLARKYHVVETITRSENQTGSCAILYDPRTDPFLTGHLHEEIPLLPAVMGIETCSQAVSAVAGGEPVVGIRNLELVNGFRMAQPRPHHAVVEVSPTDERGIARCELKGEFYDKSGQLKDPRRLYHRLEILTGEINRAVLPPLEIEIPQDGWIDVQYSESPTEHIEGHSGPVWYGPELRSLKSVRYIDGAHEVWGRFVAPDSSDLGGQRKGSRWQTPAAVLDGTLYLFEFILRKLTGTVQLPHFIGKFDFRRLPQEGQELVAQGRYLSRDKHHLTIEFDVWNTDGSAIFSCRECRMVDLNITVGAIRQ